MAQTCLKKRWEWLGEKCIDDKIWG